jgi:hypothetical protein
MGKSRRDDLRIMTLQAHILEQETHPPGGRGARASAERLTGRAVDRRAPSMAALD